ncbi:MAG: C-terminal binding protein [Chloroflexi bacterium]|nr:C-terminal binding protein [Chloroflexota bacterium]OJV90149.1 MAG: hydroxyacid dehydrogenase [Chloroflexi bacterium 54-19]
MQQPKWKVVVTDYEYEDLRYEEEVLSALGPDLELVKNVQCRTETEVIEACRDADAILNTYAPLGEKVIENLQKCQVISRFGVGVNTVDIPAATKKGIYVANVPDYCMDEVSDHALALLLSWARKVTLLNQQIKAGRWDYKLGRPIYRLRDQILGLVAFGRIPRALTPKALSFGLKVLAYDPYIDQGIIREMGAEPATLDEVLSRSDYVSLHPPLTTETRGMINRDNLRLMKSSAFLINTARGPVVDETGLVEALQAGWLAGAALDVIEEEPISPGHPFLAMDKVILTPHTAWYSEESEVEMRKKCARNVLEALSGQVPTYLVNREVAPL